MPLGFGRGGETGASRSRREDEKGTGGDSRDIPAWMGKRRSQELHGVSRTGRYSRTRRIWHLPVSALGPLVEHLVILHPRLHVPNPRVQELPLLFRQSTPDSGWPPASGAPPLAPPSPLPPSTLGPVRTPCTPGDVRRAMMLARAGPRVVTTPHTPKSLLLPPINAQHLRGSHRPDPPVVARHRALLRRCSTPLDHSEAAAANKPG